MTTSRRGYAPAHAYIATGILAIVAGGLISAFMAKQPNTFAMWVSAYLVLVGGLVQVFFGIVLGRLLPSEKAWRIYGIFALFNAGNALVIMSTAVKYAGLDWNIPVTTAGSGVLVAALVLLGLCLYSARQSRLTLAAYVVIIGLIVSIPVGLLLAHQ